jgi:hypothetical protein
MLHPVRLLTRSLEWLLAVPMLALRALAQGVIFNPRIGPLRHLVTAGLAYVVFAVLLVYVIAPLRGVIGSYTAGPALHYSAERWLATAIYDRSGAFVGTFDPRLDSKQDVNFTDKPIDIEGYTANPDHKSIPVREVPDAYWRCLVFHEDRYLSGPLNPYGIDLYGVLKIPYTSVRRSIAAKRPVLGVGGSTLPMQFARVISGTPPSSAEGGATKLGRKLREWWLAPVIYHELTRGGDITPLKQWAANHIWLAQRTGGQALHGVEVTSRVVFGVEASQLTTAQQFVLASAVNKPIILLPGSEKLNAVREDRWRYLTEVRAQVCAQALIPDEAERKKVLFELVQMAGGPPDPKVRPALQQALDQHAPTWSQRAQANPTIRANVLLPAARFGLREEMKQLHGFAWRDHVRGVTTTLEVPDNLAFHERIKGELAKLDAREAVRINPGWTLDPAKVSAERKLPHVVVVAANARGEIVRYFEVGETAPYFGSPFARDAKTGRYEPQREARHIASTGKILSAIAIANEGRDEASTLWSDINAPGRNLDTCERGVGGTPGSRRSVVAFACSLNAPLIARTAQVGQERMKRLIDGFGFALPPPDANGERTPPSTASVLGLIGGSPRRVHHMAGVVLGALSGEPGKAVPPPSLVRAYDHTRPGIATVAAGVDQPIVPQSLIRPHAVPLLKAWLSAPLCHRVGTTPHGTLKALAHWCAAGRPDLRLHFAKTGTSTTSDADATVDTWTAGGIQFANGAAYSYVVMVGTGTARDTWARKLHASQATVPLVDVLLQDLAAHAKKQPAKAAPPAPSAQAGPASGPMGVAATDWRKAAFQPSN